MSKNTKRGYQWINFDKDKCISCGKCVDYCPRDVLRLEKDSIPFMKYKDDCWYCDVCSYICPKNAIKLEEVPYLIK
jgi:NAD-dependent dihydropyrimidine dehydrogenase PreA subunit